MWTLLVAAHAAWPDLSDPPEVGGGERDAALVVAIDDYFVVPDVPGAERNGRDWYDWLLDGREIPAQRVRWLQGEEATAENLRAAAEQVGQLADGGGTVWMVFVGHGAAAPDGDPLVLGVDVQGTASSLRARGVRRSELLSALSSGGAHPVLVLDSCFSGLTPDGEALVPGLQPVVPTWADPSGEGEPTATVLTAGTGGQVAGPLPGDARPAFSYLLLGALHGWADDDGDQQITADEAVRWASTALGTTLVGRHQVPDRQGPDHVLAPSGGRPAPDLGQLVRDRRPQSAPPLPAVPGPVDLSQVDDLRVETALAIASTVEAGRRSTLGDKAQAWCLAARDIAGSPQHEQAQARCDAWTLRARADADRRMGFRDAYEALNDFVGTEGVTVDRKAEATAAFVDTWQPAFPDDFYVSHVQRASSRLQRGGDRRRLVPLGSHLESPASWDHRGPFFITWNNATVNYGVVPLSVGLAGEVDGSLGVGAQMLSAMTVGPIDLAFLNLQGMTDGGLVTVGFQAGFAPFTWRPSRRQLGELRGSLLNPIVGMGYRAGALADGGDKAAYAYAYAANQLFFTNVVGLRVEGRLPLASTAREVPLEQVPISWVVAPVINVMGNRR